MNSQVLEQDLPSLWNYSGLRTFGSSFVSVCTLLIFWFSHHFVVVGVVTRLGGSALLNLHLDLRKATSLVARSAFSPQQRFPVGGPESCSMKGLALGAGSRGMVEICFAWLAL